MGRPTKAQSIARLKAANLQAAKDRQALEFAQNKARATLYRQSCADCGHPWSYHFKDGCHATVEETGRKCIGCPGFVKRCDLKVDKLPAGVDSVADRSTQAAGSARVKIV